MREETRRARKEFERSKPTPGPTCHRCGMTLAEHNALGKGKLQLHHIIPIRQAVSAANTAENLHTLCYWCHSEWHKFWECADRSYQDFMAAAPFFQSLRK